MQVQLAYNSQRMQWLGSIHHQIRRVCKVLEFTVTSYHRSHSDCDMSDPMPSSLCKSPEEACMQALVSPQQNMQRGHTR